MRFFMKRTRKSENGQTLAMFALTIASVASIVLMAVGMGVTKPRPSYSMSLQQAVDAAALAGGAQFVRNYTVQGMVDAVTNSLNSNGIVYQTLDVETCSTLPADPILCPAPGELPRKLVRVRVTALVDANPTTVEALAEAPSLDVVMLIQNSESMALTAALPANRDPHACTFSYSCHPFQEVKVAAKFFSDGLLYFPYDREAVATYNQIPHLDLALDDESMGNTVSPAVDALKVFDPAQCVYKYEDRLYFVDPISAPVPGYTGDPMSPCRLYKTDGSYMGFDCTMFYATDAFGNRTSDNDPSWCGTNNPAAGLALAVNHLLGSYPVDWNAQPRPNSKRIIVIISTGAPNSAQKNNSAPICPVSSLGVGFTNATCRDQDVLTRHCLSASDTVCLNSNYAVDGTHTMQSVLDASNYDVYDRSFDLVDFAAANNTRIYAVGLGASIQSVSGDINGLAPGQTFLQYAANTTGGMYVYAPDANALQAAMQQIVDSISGSGVTLVTSATPTPTVTLTATETSTPAATSTSDCALLQFTSTFTQTGSTGTPKIQINMLNDNSQPVTITDLSLDWAAYHSILPTQVGDSWDLNGTLGDDTDYSSSPLNWSGTGPNIPGGSTSTLRFNFKNADNNWPGDVSASSFGLTVTFDNLCTISVTALSTATPTVTPTETLTPTSSPTPTSTATVTMTPGISGSVFQSIASHDGYILETGENTGAGGSLNSTSRTILIGDDAINRQYRAILSFDTSALPDSAVITSAVLKIKQNGEPVGKNPFDVLGNLWVDIRKGPFDFNVLQKKDFSLPATLEQGSMFNKLPIAGWYSATFNIAARNTINKTGLTQFRLRFGLDDNNNALANFMAFYSADASTKLFRPVLEIKYYYLSPTPTQTPTQTLTPTITRTPTVTPTCMCFDN